MGKYDEIIDLPHHVSRKRTPMPLRNRAAQFMPFAALTGYDDVIDETERETDEMKILSETEQEVINEKLIEAVSSKEEITITYFVKDDYKDGGSYITYQGKIRRVEEEYGLLIMQDHTKIVIRDITDIRMTDQ